MKALLENEALEDCGICDLGEAVVHDLVQQLVHEHKVILDACLAQVSPKVGTEQGHQLHHKQHCSGLGGRTAYMPCMPMQSKPLVCGVAWGPQLTHRGHELERQHDV